MRTIVNSIQTVWHSFVLRHKVYICASREYVEEAFHYTGNHSLLACTCGKAWFGGCWEPEFLKRLKP